jgi:DNA-binding NarL/FixJ family response regulator
MKPAENTSSENIRIAVVDDDKTVREGLHMLLQGSPGFNCVATYADGEQALAGIPELKPDVVLMDIDLPGINGIECILTLKAMNLPIQFIMLTVFEDPNAIFKSLSVGASGYLLKQTSPTRLMEAIQEVYNGGSPMSSEIARIVVESFQRPVTGSNPASGLTTREEEILSLLAKGYLYKEIADKAHISIDTVRSHIRHIYEKLQVKTRTEAVLKYLNR